MKSMFWRIRVPLICVCAIMLTLSAMFAGKLTSSHAATPNGTLVYRPQIDTQAPQNNRALIMVNNPETLRGPDDPNIVSNAHDPGDLADNGLSIYAARLSAGHYRDVFDHINKVQVAGTQEALGYGILLTNLSSAATNVSVEGSSIINEGGVSANLATGPLKNVFNQEATQAPTTLTIPAYGKLWILQQDAANGGAIPFGSVLSGAIDFTVDARVEIYHLTYLSSTTKPTFNPFPHYLTYEGYVKRIEKTRDNATCPTQPPVVQAGCNDTARQYKGIMMVNSNGTMYGVDSVSANHVNFLVGDSSIGKPLPVQYTYYSKQGDGTYVPLPNNTIVQNEMWPTHISQGFVDGNPNNKYTPVSADMLPLVTPLSPSGSMTINPFSPSDGRGLYPNMGNWGVVYTISGVVQNTSQSQDVCLAYRLRPNTGNSAYIAYQSGNATEQWKGLKLPVEGKIIRTYRVPKATEGSNGQVAYAFRYALGLPSGAPVMEDLEILSDSGLC